MLSATIRMEGNVVAARYFILFSVALFALTANAGTTSVPEVTKVSKLTGTYSSLTYNKESGDLNGLEVHIVLTRSGHKAIVQIAEGGAGDVVVVKIKVTGNQVAFELPAGFEPAGYFEGIVSSKHLVGTFTYKSGEKEKLALPRKKSYWD